MNQKIILFSLIASASILNGMECVSRLQVVPIQPISIKDLSTAITFNHRTKTIREWIFDTNNIGNIPVVQIVQEKPEHSPRFIKVGDLRALTARQLIIMLEGPSLYFDDAITPFCNYNTGSRMPCIACGNFKTSLFNHYNSIYVENL